MRSNITNIYKLDRILVLHYTQNILCLTDHVQWTKNTCHIMKMKEVEDHIVRIKMLTDAMPVYFPILTYQLSVYYT